MSTNLEQNNEIFIQEQVGFATYEQRMGDHIILQGEFGIIDKPTLNQRIYPRNEIEREIERLRKLARERKLFGELDHPDTLRKVKLERVSHMVLDLNIEEDKIKGRALVLKTPMGLIVEKILEAGGKIGISLRGKGTYLVCLFKKRLNRQKLFCKKIFTN